MGQARSLRGGIGEGKRRSRLGSGRRAAAGRGSRFLVGACGGFLLLLVLAAAGGAAAPAGTEGEADPAVQRGRDLYVVHCANCHGAEGRGDGSMADVLKVEPPDLTRLAARAGGTFPRHDVHQAVDGRREIPSHGRRQMPVWGLAFQERGRVAEQESDVEARIDDLVSYLESIQREE